MANKDKERPVISFLMENELITRADRLAAEGGLSRNFILGRALAVVLQDPTKCNLIQKMPTADEDEGKSIKEISPVSLRTEKGLVARVRSMAGKSGLSRNIILNRLFRIGLDESAHSELIQKNIVVRDKNKSIELNPANRGVVKKAPLPFKAAVKGVTVAAGFDDGKKEPGDKEDSFFLWLLKGLAWVGGAYVVIALALSGKGLGGSPGKGSGGPAAFTGGPAAFRGPF